MRLWDSFNSFTVSTLFSIQMIENRFVWDDGGE